VRHLVVLSDGGSGADHILSHAARTAGEQGTLVLVSVLPGSLVSRRLSPPERGRRRREEENRRTRSVAAQIARVAPEANCHVIALFGEVVSDTLLVVGNLGADGIVMGGADPDLDAMLAASPVPVLVVPDQAEAPE
jgi:nucleotide-binding universal stress UspA family protein